MIDNNLIASPQNLDEQIAYQGLMLWLDCLDLSTHAIKLAQVLKSTQAPHARLEYFENTVRLVPAHLVGTMRENPGQVRIAQAILADVMTELAAICDQRADIAANPDYLWLLNRSVDINLMMKTQVALLEKAARAMKNNNEGQ
jgi:uncharacterized protein (DUF1697 family)